MGRSYPVVLFNLTDTCKTPIDPPRVPRFFLVIHLDSTRLYPCMPASSSSSSFIPLPFNVSFADLPLSPSWSSFTTLAHSSSLSSLSLLGDLASFHPFETERFQSYDRLFLSCASNTYLCIALLVLHTTYRSTTIMRSVSLLKDSVKRLTVLCIGVPWRGLNFGARDERNDSDMLSYLHHETCYWMKTFY